MSADAQTSAQSSDVGPEHSAKHELTQWLKSHGAGVLWEEANAWDYPTFAIKRDHSGGTPDLVVLIDGKTFAVEFKTANSVGQVYDSLPQLLGYWSEHVEEEQKYMAGGTELRIDGFLTATGHSKTGRLFPRYAEKRQDYLDMDQRRRDCCNWGQLPPAEFRMTEQHIRTMWRLAKAMSAEKGTSGDTPHVGSLLSDALERPSADPTPAVLWNKSPHNQRWEVLG